MSKATDFITETDTVDKDIIGLVGEFSKHAADALSALAKVQTVSYQKGDTYTSFQAKEMIDEFGKFWKKSKYFRDKYKEK